MVALRYGEPLEKDTPPPADKSWPVVAYFDGMMSPTNPNGYGCGGWWIEDEGVEVDKGSGIYYKPGERATNNMAEYRAVIHLLQALKTNGYPTVLIRGDSQLVLRQLDGAYAVRSPGLQPLWKQARDLLHSFSRCGFEWIPREQNWKADQLARDAYATVYDHQPPVGHLPTSPKLYRFDCLRCNTKYVMRELVDHTDYHCVFCASRLDRLDNPMGNMPTGSVMHHLRELGYTTIMTYTAERLNVGSSDEQL